MLPDKIAKPNPKYRARRKHREALASNWMRVALQRSSLVRARWAQRVLREAGVPVPVSVRLED